ncbi:MAG: hypothetical protein OHK0023_14740 [Anaerolineae bacterium]
MTTATSQPSNAILLVDDDTDLLSLFEIVLVRLGYPIYKATTGKAALDLMESVRPILIVLDLALPGMSGIEVLTSIRADERYNNIRIVVLTAVPVMMEREHVDLVDIMLTKPITPRQLEQTVRDLLGKA